MGRLSRKFARSLVRRFWGTVILVVLVVAVCVQIGREAFPMLNDYRSQIASHLSTRLGVQVEIGAIDATWVGLRPQLSLQEVSLSATNGTPIFSAGRLEGELSLTNSIRAWQLIWRDLEFYDLEMQFDQGAGGRWRVGDIRLARPQLGNQTQAVDPVDIFLLARHVTLQNATFRLNFRTGQQAELQVPKVELENEPDFHRLTANLAVDSDTEAFAVVMEGEGDPRSEETFQLAGYVALASFPMEKAVAALGLDNWEATDPGQWRQGHRLDTRLWFSGNPYRAMKLKGQLRADGLPLQAPGGALLPDQVRTKLNGRWETRQGWQLSMTDVQMEWEDFQAPSLNMTLSQAPEVPLKLAVDSLQVEQWLDVAYQANLVQGSLAQALAKLAPGGQLSNLEITIPGADLAAFQVRGQVQQGQVNAFGGGPEVRSVDGYVEASIAGGRIVIDSRNGFSMYYPDIYRDVMHYDSAAGELRWAVRRELQRVELYSGLLKLAGEEGEGRGYLHLVLPYGGTGAEPLMTLMVGLQHTEARFHKRYLPYGVPETLLQWLDGAVKDGRIYNAGFVWHGSLSSNAAVPPAVQLMGEVEDAWLQFSPDWPALTEAHGRLMLDNRYLDVRLDTGLLAHNQITDGRVKLQGNSGDDYQLAVQSHLAGKLPDLLNLVRESPLQGGLSRSGDRWRTSGTYSAEVDLMIPLHAEGEGEQDIHIALTDVGVQVEQLDLALTELAGTLHYQSEQGLSSSGLKFQLWGETIAADLQTSQVGGLPEELTVSLEGQLPLERLVQWQELPDVSHTVAGSAGFTGRVTVPLSQQGETQAPTLVQFSSSLQGVRVDLPAPFAKTAASEVPLGLQAVLGAAPHFRISYGDLLRLQFQVQDGLESASLALSNEFAPLQPGFAQVTGSIETVEVPVWRDLLDRFAESQESDVSFGTELPLIPRFDVHVGKLALEKATLRNLQLAGVRRGGTWSLEASSPQLEGSAEVHDDDRPMEVMFDSLHIPASPPPDNPEKSAAADSRLLGDIQLNQLPAVDFTVKSLTVGQQDWGGWSFRLRPVPDGVALRDLRGEVFNVRVGATGVDKGGAELVWLRSGDRNSTFFSGTVHTGNLGPLLSKFDQAQLLENETAVFDVALLWPDAPNRVSLEQLQGKVALTVEDGRFIRGAEAGNNPFLRLFGLLNFDTLVRRLQLDFSDLLQEGMAFDTVKGALAFDRGQLFVTEPLLLQAPSSTLRFSGVLDATEETIDASLVATLPVAGNLTVAAAFVGGLPAALGVYAVGKLFKEQVDQASSIRYSIEGSWEEPEIRVDRIFDAGKKSEVAEPATDGNSRANAKSDGAGAAEDSIQRIPPRR